MIDRLFLAALTLYVFVLPISGTTALRSIAFATLVGCTAWQVAQRRLRLHYPLLRPWSLYAAVALASLVYAADAAYSLSEIRSEIAYPAIIFCVAASWFRQREWLTRLVWLVIAGNVLFLVGQFTGAWTTGVGATATVIVGTLPWIAIAAAKRAGERGLASALPLAALCIANLVALAFTMNRQGWLSLALAFSLAAVLTGRNFWTRRRVLAAGIAALLFIAAMVLQFQLRAQSIARGYTTAPENVSATVLQRDSRWALWRFSAERIAERPWSGGGFGREAFDRLYRDYHLRSNDSLWHAHNMLINKGIQMGVPGMLAFVALWAALVVACWRGLGVPAARTWAIAALAMIAGVFTRNMVDDFFVRDHVLLFWLLCGAYLGTLQRLSGGAEQRH